MSAMLSRHAVKAALTVIICAVGMAICPSTVGAADSKGLLISQSPGSDIDQIGSSAIVSYVMTIDGRPNIVVSRLDGSGLRLLLSNTDINSDAHPSWSADGQVMAFRGKDGRVKISGNSGLSPYQVTSADYSEPIVSPDGRMLAVVSRNDVTGKVVFGLLKKRTPEIYAINLATMAAKRLTDNDADDLDPDWSPDGKRITFSSERDGKGAIYTMDANGGNTVRLTKTGSTDSHPAWSPDGKNIAFVRDRRQVWVMSPDGSKPRLVWTASRSDCYGLDWAPDGKALMVEAEGSVLYCPLNGGVPKRIGTGTNPATAALDIPQANIEVSGSVTKPFGTRGIVNAEIKVTPLGNQGASIYTTTDASGSWTVGNISDAVEVELISTKGYKFGRTKTTVVPDLIGTQNYVANFDAIDDRYQARGSVKYDNSDGRKVGLRSARIYVIYYDEELASLVTNTVQTDANGRFSTSMIRGEVILIPELEGWAFSPVFNKVSGFGSGEVEINAVQAVVKK